MYYTYCPCTSRHRNLPEGELQRDKRTVLGESDYMLDYIELLSDLLEASPSFLVRLRAMRLLLGHASPVVFEELGGRPLHLQWLIRVAAFMNFPLD